MTEELPFDQLQETIHCTKCNDNGYIWISEDSGHDFQIQCPICNPKIDLYAADRDWAQCDCFDEV